MLRRLHYQVLGNWLVSLNSLSILDIEFTLINPNNERCSGRIALTGWNDSWTAVRSLLGGFGILPPNLNNK